ncbi:MAG: 23S rRNA (pseudouridine(1915)-N(3))-methyltransferase RlmH [bacterium]
MGGLNLTLLTVGKSTVPFVQPAIEHYRKRISGHASLSIKQIRAVPLRSGTSVVSALAVEKGRILEALGGRNVRVMVDERGTSFRSADLAAWLEGHMQHGRSRFTFVVGGPLGLSADLLREADLVLSISAMTLSHELALLVLLEQLYRSVAILHGLPYPK